MNKLLQILNIFNRRFNNRYTIILLSLLSIVITYIVFKNSSRSNLLSPRTISNLIISNLVILGLIFTFIASKAASNKYFDLKIIKKHSLQKKFVKTFSAIVIVPILLVSIFSVLFINNGIKVWFNKRVSTAIEESRAVGEAYLTEHKEGIRTDILFLANDIDKQFYIFSSNKDLLENYLDIQSKIRSLSEIVIFQNNRVVAATKFHTIKSLNDIPKEAISKAEHGDVVVVDEKYRDSVKSVIKLQNFFNSYIVVGRYVDEKVLGYINKVNGAASEYQNLLQQFTTFQMQYSIIFILLTFLIIFLVAFYALIFANSITSPLIQLVEVTEKVQHGNLQVRAKNTNLNDELGLLSKAFNEMIIKLEKQRQDLIIANDMLDEKSSFNEKVLNGVSAGVIALDIHKNIKLVNPTARKILNYNEEADKSISDLIEGIENLFKKFEEKSLKLISNEQLELIVDNKKISLIINIQIENHDDEIIGYILTFDNITDLVSAQRKAAWSDVARRIAHEMKNPLTPIRLSAERIKKRYTKYIAEDDLEVFNKCASTIINNVDNITAMVNEFVEFARIPAPKFEILNLRGILKEVINTQSYVNENISVKLENSEIHNTFGDKAQLSRAFLNIIKNSYEAILEKDIANPEVQIKLHQNNIETIIEIIDNGKGFDLGIISMLAEPYMTTKQGGSGLGLAIVKKIIDDHNGKISFDNLKETEGAIVTVTLPHNFNTSKDES